MLWLMTYSFSKQNTPNKIIEELKTWDKNFRVPPSPPGAEMRYCEVLRRNTNVSIGIAKSEFSKFRNTNNFENSFQYCLISWIKVVKMVRNTNQSQISADMLNIQRNSNTKQ